MTFDDGSLEYFDRAKQAASKARNWRARRFERFSQKEAACRTWIPLAEIARRGTTATLAKLRESLLRGEFDKVLHLHPWSPKIRMNRDRFMNICEIYAATPWVIDREYTARCWIPHGDALRWCRNQNVNVAGWLEQESSDRPKNPRGRKRGSVKTDDAAYLIEMARLIGSGKSVRTAAKLAVDKVGARQRAGRQSIEDRIRTKFRMGLMR